MSWPGVFDPGNNCSWCGHRWPHDQPCPGTITVRRGRPPVEQQVPCPCQRHTFGKPVDATTQTEVYARVIDSDMSQDSDTPGSRTLAGPARPGVSDHQTSKES